MKNEAQKGTKSYQSFLLAILHPVFEKGEYEWMIQLIKEYFDSRYIQINSGFR